MLNRGAEWRDLNTSPNLLVAALVLAAGLPCIGLFDITAPAAVLEEHLSIVGSVPELEPKLNAKDEAQAPHLAELLVPLVPTQWARR
jgi:hypothetical protein